MNLLYKELISKLKNKEELSEKDNENFIYLINEDQINLNIEKKDSFLIIFLEDIILADNNNGELNFNVNLSNELKSEILKNYPILGSKVQMEMNYSDIDNNQNYNLINTIEKDRLQFYNKLIKLYNEDNIKVILDLDTRDLTGKSYFVYDLEQDFHKSKNNNVNNNKKNKYIKNEIRELYKDAILKR